MKKYLLITISSVFIAYIIFYHNYDTDHFKIYLGNGFMIVQSTENLHCIYDNIKINESEERLLRGYIRGYQTQNDILLGLLSTEYFNTQEISEYAEENDKNGFFIINMKTKKILSGLDTQEYKKILRDEYNINNPPHLKNVKHFDQISSCFKRWK